MVGRCVPVQLKFGKGINGFLKDEVGNNMTGEDGQPIKAAIAREAGKLVSHVTRRKITFFSSFPADTRNHIYLLLFLLFRGFSRLLNVQDIVDNVIEDLGKTWKYVLGFV